MKKLNFLRILMGVSFLTFFALSCKKEKPIENPLEDAKEWYLNFTAKSKHALKASNAQTLDVTKEIAWNKSQIFKFTDGKDIIITPVKIMISKEKEADGSYTLLIYKSDNVYTSQILYNKQKDYFSNATSSDLETAIMVNKENSRLKSLAKSNTTLLKSASGKVMNYQVADDVCIDWYLIDTITWPDGQISVNETYLYSTCSTGGGGGGGGGYSPSDYEEINRINAETKPEIVGSELSSYLMSTSPNGLERKEAYKWAIAGNPLSGYVVWSHETGTHKKVGPNNDDWEWKDLSHDNFSVTGKPAYMTVTVTQNGTAIPTLGKTVAGISIGCNIEASVIFRGSPFGYPTVNFERNSPVFYIHP